MQRYFLAVFFVLAAALAGCGGGGGGSVSVPRPHVTSTPVSPQVRPTPTASGLAIQGHAYIGIDARVHAIIYPANAAPVLPPGATDQGPLANAVVIYPDGSKQIADATGMFVPSQSAYGQKHKALLGSSAQSQPAVMVVDPRGAASPLYATIPAYSSAAGLIHRVAQNAMRRGFSMRMRAQGVQTNLAGITLLPQQSSLLSSGLLYLNVLGTDANNNVVDLSGSQITWSANFGQVAALQNGTSAYYFPPALSTGAEPDVVYVAVAINGDPNNVFYASAPVSVIAPASAATVSGTISVSGTPVPQGLAVFAQAPPSTLFTPTLWLAQADANGNYTAQIPANAKFALGVGVDQPFSPSGSYGVFLAQQPNGTNSYTSVGQGASDTLALTLDPSGVPFSFASPYDTGSVPAYVSFIRNAWYGGHEAVVERIFEADSGIQSLLQNVPSSFPSPANVAPVGGGQLSRWCYQWQSIGGTPSLVVAENTDKTCTQPGNTAYVVTPNGGGSFTYAKYASSTLYSLSGTIDVITNSLLVESGTWSQAVTTDANGNITSDVVNDNGGFYDVDNQVLDSPVYSESATYQYTLGSNGLANETLSDTRISAFTGTTTSQVNAQITQTASYANCVGTTSQCFTISGTEQADIDGSGTLDGSYSISDTYNGDGTGQLTFASTNPGDSSKIVLPLSADAYSNSNNCLVCLNNPGQIYDTDGITNLGTIQIDNTLLTKVIIYDTPPGQGTIGPDQIDSFGFVL